MFYKNEKELAESNPRKWAHNDIEPVTEGFLTHFSLQIGWSVKKYTFFFSYYVYDVYSIMFVVHCRETPQIFFV